MERLQPSFIRYVYAIAKNYIICMSASQFLLKNNPIHRGRNIKNVDHNTPSPVDEDYFL